MKQLAFTLAEVLITLAIIGVVAAIAVPSVISNSQQQEFKTGLRKAVGVLNSAITMNMALDGETPYDNKDLFRFLQKRMNILKTLSNLTNIYNTYTIKNNGSWQFGQQNAVFYTTDGMRYEFGGNSVLNLHESNIHPCESTNSVNAYNFNYNKYGCLGCGSYGLNHNPNQTTKPPCLILVDVNGDKKPTPGNVNCLNTSCALRSNAYYVPLPQAKKLRDIFSILITEDRAIPFGIVAQKAMYQAQK